MESINTNSFQDGYLELIIGPMFSGKTSHIINLYKQYTLANMKPFVINYSEDKRYDATKLSTHDKQMIDSNNTLTISDILTKEVLASYNVFLINEGQFFQDIYEGTLTLLEHNKIIHICGLDGDFKKNVFGDLYKLIPHCDNIIKKKSICMNCRNGTKAIFSHRITSEQATKVIGSDNYIPLCRSCYKTFN